MLKKPLHNQYEKLQKNGLLCGRRPSWNNDHDDSVGKDIYCQGVQKKINTHKKNL